jgi:hypothetical protein
VGQQMSLRKPQQPAKPTSPATNLQCSGVAVVGLVRVAHPAAAEVRGRRRCLTVTALCRCRCSACRWAIIVVHAVQGQAQGHDGDAGLGGEAELVDMRRYGSGLRECVMRGVRRVRCDVQSARDKR